MAVVGGLLAALVLATALANAAAPTVTTGAATDVAETSATLNGSVNPQEVEIEECFFEYGRTVSYGQTAPCAESSGEIGEGTAPVSVHAEISGLDLGAEYHFRLVAKNSAAEQANGGDSSFKLESPPIIGGQWASSVVFSEAVLKAEINPEGTSTTFHVEYGTDTSYGTETKEKGVSADSEIHRVVENLEGLSAGTTYHYRFVATNSIGTTEGEDHTFTTYAGKGQIIDCPNQTFRYGQAATLPDCRAYEMVSPIDKDGASIIAKLETFNRPAVLDQSALSGDKITYGSYHAFGDALSGAYTNQYMSSRQSDGWVTHSINPPSEGGSVLGPGWIDTHYKAFSEDLSIGWLQSESGLVFAPGAIEGYPNLFRNEISDGGATSSFSALTQGEPTRNATTWSQVSFEGFSENGNHAVYTLRDAITPDAPLPAVATVYEWDSGTLSVASILPGGEPYTGHSTAGWSRTLPNLKTRVENVTNVVSDDGSTIFWTARSGSFGTGELFARINGEETISVSGMVPLSAARYVGASDDGSKVLLANASNTSLYEVHVPTETVTPLTDELNGVLGASDDLSYVYFISESVLDAGATAAQPNLYVSHNGVPKFVATVSAADANVVTSISTVSNVAEEPTSRTSRVTANGKGVVFMSDRSITGYDNLDAESGEPISEIYRYTVESDEVVCVSCNPSGARPIGDLMPSGLFNSLLRKYDRTVAAWIPGWQLDLRGSRSISADGNRIFFNSFDALLPRDTNGAVDVYQWEAQGTGTCAESPGCLDLISSGTSTDGAEFVDAGASGEDVFIRTNSSLVSQDPGLIDIYDARVGGGFPAPDEGSACTGDACQSVPDAPPASSPASATFVGAGNPSAAARSCARIARVAQKFQRRAKGLRRRSARMARSSQRAAQAKRTRRKSRRLAKKARKLSANAKRCRRIARRRASTSREAGR